MPEDFSEQIRRYQQRAGGQKRLSEILYGEPPRVLRYWINGDKLPGEHRQLQVLSILRAHFHDEHDA